MNTNWVEVYDKAARAYLNDCKYRGLSDTTFKTYKDRIEYFREFWVKNSDGESQPKPSDIRAWRDSMIDENASAKTVKAYMKTLSGFFDFACDEDPDDGSVYFESNPVLNKLYPVVKDDHKPYTKVLTADDLKNLWANQRNRGTDRLWARNYAIITLLLDGKIRNAELLNLKLSDIHFADEEDPYNYLAVTKGKGNKYREVDLNDISVSAIKLYLKSGVRPADVSDDDYLFGTTAEHKFGGKKNDSEEWHKGTSQWLSDLVEKHVRRVTGKSGFRSHSMRHNGAIMELNNGESLERIQAELGHSSIQTTEIYAGRLQSKRHTRNMKEVYEVRDEWAEKNRMMLEGA